MLLLDKSFWEVRTRIYKKDGTERLNRGVFAKKDITGGTLVGDYIGHVIKVADEDNYETGDDFYLMYYSDKVSIAPDPKSIGIHVFNHSCAPNCAMYTYKGHTLYFALRKIFKGEELTICYMLAPIDKDCNPCLDACYCKSQFCLKTMHVSKKTYDKWSRFDNMITKKTKRAKAVVGKLLPLLSSYPKELADHSAYRLIGKENVAPLVCDEKKLPTKKEIRKRIRTTGHMLSFPKLNLIVLGVVQNKVITKELQPTPQQPTSHQKQPKSQPSSTHVPLQEAYFLL